MVANFENAFAATAWSGVHGSIRFLMPAGLDSGGFDLIARKWRDLAERRRAYFVELYRTGRWQRYYTEDQFRSRIRDVMRAARKWDELAKRREAGGNDVQPAA